ncbi:MAG TPA: alanine:cation symporter family protein, partial [Kiritimatiellia bacterium]|nr:alanine:cation symporter family protein [Kiritimatiellia bacterium]
ETCWTIADIFNGLMALPNLVALLCLSPLVLAETRAYLRERGRPDTGQSKRFTGAWQ